MTEPLTHKLTGRRFIARAWSLAYPYWTSEERWIARGLLIASVGLTLFMVYMEVLFNDWQKDFYNALQDKQEADFWVLLRYFCLLAAIMIAASVYQHYLQSQLQMRWRAWLTERYSEIWLDRNTFYRLELERHTDNPDQRIAEDVRDFTSGVLSLGLGLLNALVTLVSFIGILWVASGPISVAVSGHAITLPGYMVWAAILYALAGSAVTYVLGRPLVRLANQQQTREADFRFGLMRLRENAEGVALYHGAAIEASQSKQRFAHVRSNWWALISYTKRLRFFTVGYAQIAIIFPCWVAAGRYFSGSITLGQLVQISSAFDKVRESLSWFVTSYAELAQWKASVDRLLVFHDALDAAHDAQSASGFTMHPQAAANGINGISGTRAISGSGLIIGLPDGRSVIANSAFTLRAGDRVLLTGASGSGKSTLFRALAGIWPFARGDIDIPAGARMLFLPQKPYIPIGTLRQAVAYPEPPDLYSDESLAMILHAVGLDRLAGSLDAEANWSMQLSLGEQQRLAIARALLLRPDWLFLDEATASLDETAEAALYQRLQDDLPDTTVVSIAHRPGVARFHSRHWAVAGGELQASA